MSLDWDAIAGITDGTEADRLGCDGNDAGWVWMVRAGRLAA
jgi:hypothetical protein